MSSPIRSRAIAICLIMSAAFMALSIRVINLHVGSKDIALQIMRSRSTSKYDPLAMEHIRLNTLLSNIDRMTIDDIRKSIEQAQTFIKLLQSEQTKNLEALTELRKRVANEGNSLAEIKQERQTIETVNSQDLHTLSLLLARDTRSSKWAGFILGSIVSFPFGVASSLCATALLAYWFRRRNKGMSVIGRGNNIKQAVNKPTNHSTLNDLHL